MQNLSYFQERLSRLGSGEALNVTFTTSDGNQIRKVKFNPRTARSLVEVPNNKGFVFNLKEGFEGLDNFLRLRGYDREKIRNLHQQLGKKEVKSPRRRAEDRDNDDLYQKYKNIVMDNLDRINSLLKMAQSTSLSRDQRLNLRFILLTFPKNYTEIVRMDDPDPKFFKRSLSKQIQSLPNSLQSLFPDLFSLMDEYNSLNLSKIQKVNLSKRLNADPNYLKLINDYKDLMNNLYFNLSSFHT